MDKPTSADQEKPQAFTWRRYPSLRLRLDGPPPPGILDAVVRQVGAIAPDAMRLRIPYNTLVERSVRTRDGFWKGVAHGGIGAALGVAGAGKPWELNFGGTGTAHHCLIVGRTGSGKSNLMHVLITSLAIGYSPEEVQLCLVDFKQGVEFQAYAALHLPHARVIAIESERESGLSVLQSLVDEMDARGRAFNRLGVKDLDAYRLAQPDAPMARVVFVADEFQEFFREDDSLANQARTLLDRLSRMGRSHGIHIVLGTQTLTGHNGLARSTMEQVGIRIALMCSEQDSRLVFAEDNPGARGLRRPGEAIYNPLGGIVEGNQRVHVAILERETHQSILAKIAGEIERENVRRRNDGRVALSLPDTRVFAGNRPADIGHCEPLRKAVSENTLIPAAPGIRAWLGEPITLRQAVEVRLRRQSGSHLLVVTRDERQGVGELNAALLALAAQTGAGDTRFVVADFCAADSPWAGNLRRLGEELPHDVDVVGRNRLGSLLLSLGDELKARMDADQPADASVFLLFYGLHRARDLRSESSYAMSEAALPLARIIRDGPEFGFHVLVWADAQGNLERVLDRNCLNEFAMRAIGPMPEGDAHTLVGDSTPAKLDRPHRMVFYDEDQPGVMVKYRPYSVPDDAEADGVSVTTAEYLQQLEDMAHLIRQRARRAGQIKE